MLNLDIEIALILLNLCICLFTIIAVNYRYSQMKSMYNSIMNGEAKDEIVDVNEKKRKKHGGVINALKSALQLSDDLDDDLDLFDDDEASYEKDKVIQFKEKSETEDVIGLIDLYEVELDLSHKLVEDIKAGKYDKLNKERLIELNKKYRQDEIKNITSKSKPTYSVNFKYVPTNQPVRTNNGIERRMFTTAQDMVDYVADKSRMVYDKKIKTVRKVDSFGLDIYGNLLIYYGKYELPVLFEPYGFGEAA